MSNTSQSNPRESPSHKEKDLEGNEGREREKAVEEGKDKQAWARILRIHGGRG